MIHYLFSFTLFIFFQLGAMETDNIPLLHSEYTPAMLEAACKSDDMILLCSYVVCGGDVNKVIFPAGRTLLHMGALYGKSDVVQVLFELGAELKLDSLGQTPVHLAVCDNNKKLLDVFPDNTLLIPNIDGNIPLVQACYIPPCIPTAHAKESLLDRPSLVRKMQLLQVDSAIKRVTGDTDREKHVRNELLKLAHKEPITLSVGSFLARQRGLISKRRG